MFYYSDSTLEREYQQPKTSIVEKTTDKRPLPRNVETKDFARLTSHLVRG